MRGVVLDGQWRRDLHVFDQVTQTWDGGLGQAKHLMAEVLLELRVAGSAVAQLGALPRAELRRGQERDELRGVHPLPRLDRRERYEDTLREPLVLDRNGAVVVEVTVDPRVPTVDADGARILTQPQVHGHGRWAGAVSFDQRPDRRGRLPDGALGGQQPAECDGCAGIRDHGRGAVDHLGRGGVPVVADPHPRRRAVLDEDLDDLLGDADRTARLLDALLEGAGDPGAAALREPGAVQIVPDDPSMDDEGAA